VHAYAFLLRGWPSAGQRSANRCAAGVHRPSAWRWFLDQLLVAAVGRDDRMVRFVRAIAAAELTGSETDRTR
jgi:hypothetical protein